VRNHIIRECSSNNFLFRGGQGNLGLPYACTSRIMPKEAIKSQTKHTDRMTLKKKKPMGTCSDDIKRQGHTLNNLLWKVWCSILANWHIPEFILQISVSATTTCTSLVCTIFSHSVSLCYTSTGSNSMCGPLLMKEYFCEDAIYASIYSWSLFLYVR